ncbi:hypothetical protein DUNSADRAFT_16392 [Dunaliella salina]|uniref:F-box domain-containing protein n=1 Tax=Dunaliella salina TaxID=3046 RepID=A0ABQ7G3Z0_DUNSA|nr:hypothetical protein DUNSADRAFT_16392 [Dunaliella salina]|eukprot:KAF5829234.1 hypothetical protein DUNSADRAFT_16392 [Dunaliella salina]
MALIVHPRFPLAGDATLHRARGLDDVPQDLLYKIAEHIEDAEDLHTYGCISRRCRLAAAEDRLWRRLHHEHHPFMPSREPKSGEWKHLYWYNKRLQLAMMRSMQDELHRMLHPRMYGQQAFLIPVPTA